MCYKTNYELYNDRTMEANRQHPSEDVLNPLATLYPHVSALQQPNTYYTYPSEWYSGDGAVGYWAGAFAGSEPPSPTGMSFTGSRRSHNSTKTRLISKVRRILRRDTRSTPDLRKRSLRSSS